MYNIYKYPAGKVIVVKTYYVLKYNFYSLFAPVCKEQKLVKVVKANIGFYVGNIRKF